MALLTFLLIYLAAPVPQQNQFEQQVRQQLASIGDSLKAKGFEATHQVYTGALKEGATESIAFRLRRGVRYAFVGVCDQDCGDLDARLFDPADQEIGRDVEKDDTPVVEVLVDKTGEYTLRIEMAECAEQPCAFGVGVFAAGQDEFERQVTDQLDRAGRDLVSKGFRMTHRVFTGALKADEAENVVFELEPTSTYVVLGVCDNDCKDLDLQLLNAGGKEIDRDVEADDAPVVAVAPTRRERFTVKAMMAACSANPCRYGLGVFAK